MRPIVLLFVAVTLAACSNPNEPAPIPDMTGGWSGQRETSWTTNRGPGTQSCNEVWIVSGQDSSGSFSGSMTSSGAGACSFRSWVTGRVDQFGNVSVEQGIAQLCFLLSGGTSFGGVVSPNGGLTARRHYSMRCAVDGGSLDFNVTEVYTMDRR